MTTNPPTPGDERAAIARIILEARNEVPGTRWDDGMTEGVARIELMLAEKAADRILALRTRDEAARSATSEEVAGWQPIETAPRDGTDILLYYPLDGLRHDLNPQIVIGWWRGNHWVFQSRAVRGYSPDFQPTHWMPLPARPEALQAKDHSNG